MRITTTKLAAVGLALALTGCGTATGSTGVGPVADGAGDTQADGGPTDSIDTSDAETTGGETVTSDGGPGVDSTDGDTTGEPCGPVDELGTCQGQVVQWCDEGQLASYDCSEAVEDPSLVVCKEISAQWGHDCALAEGVECADVDEEGNEIMWFCDGDGAGCLVDAEGSACATGVGACKATDEAAACSGDHLHLYCVEGQAMAYDCKAFGATCGEAGGAAACVDVAQGGACDGESIRCADGLTCQGVTEEDWGACE